MRFDTLILAFLSTLVSQLEIIGTQKKCKTSLDRKDGMSDLLNFGCRLVRGTYQLSFQNICEGEPCPGLGSGNRICLQGSCIDRLYTLGKPRNIAIRPFIRAFERGPINADKDSIPASYDGSSRASPASPSKPRAKAVRGAGKLDIQVLRAEVPDTDEFSAAPDSYAIVCVHAGVVRESSSSPLSDRTGCDCKTQKIEDENNPSWEHVCQSWDVNRYNASETVITVEVYDEEFVVADDFVAGGEISVSDVIKRKQKGKELEMQLTGPYPCKIYIIASWRAIR